MDESKESAVYLYFSTRANHGASPTKHPKHVAKQTLCQFRTAKKTTSIIFSDSGILLNALEYEKIFIKEQISGQVYFFDQ